MPVALACWHHQEDPARAAPAPLPCSVPGDGAPAKLAPLPATPDAAGSAPPRGTGCAGAALLRRSHAPAKLATPAAAMPASSDDGFLVYSVMVSSRVLVVARVESRPSWTAACTAAATALSAAVRLAACCRAPACARS